MQCQNHSCPVEVRLLEGKGEGMQVLCDKLVSNQFPAMTNRGGVSSQIRVVLKVGTLVVLPCIDCEAGAFRESDFFCFFQNSCTG